MTTVPENPLPKRSDELDADPVVEAYKADIDRTLIRESLAMTVDQRLRRLVDLQKRAIELRKAGERARRTR